MLQIDTKYLPKDTTLYKRGFFWYKDYGKLYTNVTRYDLHSLYASLSVALKDHFKSDRSQELSIIESFLENRQFLKTKDPVNYQRLKTITNSFYGDLWSQDKALITNYVNEFYQDFIEQYKDVIIAIDVDRLVIDQKKLEENKISFDRGLKGISFTTLSLKYYYNEELHNFVAEDETGKTWSRGFDSDKVKQLQSQIKAETRRRTLTDLGI